jgi:hypothetical protein
MCSAQRFEHLLGGLVFGIELDRALKARDCTRAIAAPPV